MLDSDVESLLLLDAPGDGRCHVAGETGILGEILKVPAAKRIAMDVDGGGQPVGAAVLLHLLVNGIADLVHQLRIPGLGQSVGNRESGGVLVENGVLIGITQHQFFHQIRHILHDGQRHVDGLDTPLLGQGRAFLDPQSRRAIA